MKTIEFDEKCQTCKGTGLYVGMAEYDGAAIVCYKCKGTGCHHFEHHYEEFIKRDSKKRVEQVYQHNPGIGLGKGKNNEYRLEEFGGMPYVEWLKNPSFPARSENRKCTCPAWWYQSVDYDKKPRWAECLGCGAFSGCTSFGSKNKCWERWDKEFGKK